MSHSEPYLNIEAIRQRGGIKKSEDDGEKWEIMTESNGVESKAKRKKEIEKEERRKEIRGPFITLPHY